MVPGRRTVWDGVIELTKKAEANCVDARLWASQLSASLISVVEFPSTELAEVLVSYICWDNNVPILWKFLERAMALKLVSPLVVLALLADRFFFFFFQLSVNPIFVHFSTISRNLGFHVLTIW